VITALFVTLVGGLAFVQAFAYGAVQLERLGYRRQALALLDGEMEYWRGRFQRVAAGELVPAGETEARSRDVPPATPERGPGFRIEPELSGPRRDRRNNLRYQDLRVVVSYERAHATDTLVLESRFYVP
jgi:hypothetical protein